MTLRETGFSLYSQPSSINYLKGMNLESISRLDLSRSFSPYIHLLSEPLYLKASTDAANSRRTEPTNHLLTIHITCFQLCPKPGSHLQLLAFFFFFLSSTSSSPVNGIFSCLVFTSIANISTQQQHRSPPIFNFLAVLGLFLSILH